MSRPVTPSASRSGRHQPDAVSHHSPSPRLSTSQRRMNSPRLSTSQRRMSHSPRSFSPAAQPGMSQHGLSPDAVWLADPAQQHQAHLSPPEAVYHGTPGASPIVQPSSPYTPPATPGAVAIGQYAMPSMSYHSGMSYHSLASGRMGQFMQPQDDYGEENTHRPPDYILSSIVGTICCLPLGIVALCFGCRSRGEYEKGHFHAARQSSKNARDFMLTSIILGLALIGYIVVRQVVLKQPSPI